MADPLVLKLGRRPPSDLDALRDQPAVHLDFVGWSPGEEFLPDEAIPERRPFGPFLAWRCRLQKYPVATVGVPTKTRDKVSGTKSA